MNRTVPQIYFSLLFWFTIGLVLVSVEPVRVLGQGAGRPPATPTPTRIPSVARSRSESPCSAQPPRTATGRTHVVNLGGSVRLEMVEIPAGSFCMGSSNGDSNERPVHRVTIDYSFDIGRYEITVGEWLAVMGEMPETLRRIQRC